MAVIASFCGCARLQADTHVEGEAFEYREIYLPLHSERDFQEHELNNLDTDWGIWGHNLKNVLPKDPSITVFATIDGDQDEDQFCFTSKKLFQYISDFIDNNYAPHDSIKFAIIPNDNEIACLCETCVEVGNTEGNATPAVYDMVEKLAKKYPTHTFFTSHYLTTAELPTKKLPANTGVLVSAMEYPLRAVGSPGEEKFKKMLTSWQGKTDKVYVWDYINNFDDYFTPFPVFTVMQRRLQTYRDAGVDGVFLNGSGTDYSSFSRLKKAVLAKMLINPDIDWKTELRETAKSYYPVAGEDIANFMIAQEDMVAANGKELPLYEGVEKARTIYLPTREFVEFYNKLQDQKKVATGQEKKELETLAEALSLTVIELKRIDGHTDVDGHLRRRLHRLAPKEIEVYNEGCWAIEKYLSDYEYMLDHKEKSADNMLKGVTLVPITELDPDYPDISLVTDGLLGIPSNYHNGNLISSANPAFTVAIPRQPEMNRLQVWLVYNPAFKIGLPTEVKLNVGGTTVATKVPAKPTNHSGHSMVEFTDIPAEGEIQLSLVKDPEVKTMAIDEIEAYR